MKRPRIVGAVSAALVLTAAVLFGQAQQGKGVIFVPASAAHFTERMPGASMHLIWGDTLSGPFGGFTKFTPGFDAGLHTHTNDVLLVVLRGAYLYRDEAGAKRVGPGDFIRIPGGHKHWSGGDAKEGALFYQETFGKFDLIPAK
jgi:hypothetical protein